MRGTLILAQPHSLYSNYMHTSNLRITGNIPMNTLTIGRKADNIPVHFYGRKFFDPQKRTDMSLLSQELRLTKILLSLYAVNCNLT